MDFSVTKSSTSCLCKESCCFCSLLLYSVLLFNKWKFEHWFLWFSKSHYHLLCKWSWFYCLCLQMIPFVNTSRTTLHDTGEHVSSLAHYLSGNAFHVSSLNERLALGLSMVVYCVSAIVLNFWSVCQAFLGICGDSHVIVHPLGLFLWCVMLMDFLLLNLSCIPGINSTFSSVFLKTHCGSSCLIIFA